MQSFGRRAVRSDQPKRGRNPTMWTSLRRALALVLASVSLTGMACAGGGGGPSIRGPIFDITHFDVIPFNLNMPDSFEQTAYTALFAYRDASLSDPGSKSFRVVNWLLASNHSQIIDVWSSLDAFEAHLAQAHSTDFRFAVQVQPLPPPPGFNCCIGSPIDDRQIAWSSRSTRRGPAPALRRSRSSATKTLASLS